MHIYYCKNEKEIKKVMLDIFIYYSGCSNEEALYHSNIVGCICNEDDEYSCYGCDNESCSVNEMCDKGKINIDKIEFGDKVCEAEYPCLVINNDEMVYGDDVVEIFSISECKQNTKNVSKM